MFLPFFVKLFLGSYKLVFISKIPEEMPLKRNNLFLTFFPRQQYIIIPYNLLLIREHLINNMITKK